VTETIEKHDAKMLAEAALFMSTEPLSPTALSSIMGVEFGEGIETLDTLCKEFNSRNSSLEIIKTDDGRYRMQVRQEFMPSVKHLAATTDLPKSVIRTLSIIAFKQPVRQSDIAKLRGNKAYEHVERLEQDGFIKKVRKGHTFLLETTRKFNDYFQLPEQQIQGQLKTR
jgi:segregation and condensation protein B